MEEYKTRVLTEYYELSCKIKKLDNFISSEKFNELSEIEQILLEKQRIIMADYIDVLGKRIGVWKLNERC